MTFFKAIKIALLSIFLNTLMFQNIYYKRYRILQRKLEPFTLTQILQSFSNNAMISEKKVTSSQVFVKR